MKQINWEKLKKEPPLWFRDAKFGLFFHWGPYSVPGYQNEWYSRNMYAKGLEQNIYHEKTFGNLQNFGYKEFYPLMTGARFDAAEWAAMVKRSGARYAGPVAEHADNFSMWESNINPVNSVNYGPGRDIVGECFKEFRKKGIKTVATFHHQWLWGWFMSTDNEADVYVPSNEKYYGPALPLETNRYHPYRLPDEKFCRSWRDKVCEVVDKYSPDMIYFDSRACIIEEKYRYAIASHYYCESDIEAPIITYKQNDFPETIGVYDIECGQFSAAKPFGWQVDDRLEDNVTWCMVQEPRYKSAETIIHYLCDIVAKNGNLLLNVGPYADGSFHPQAVHILEQIGDWLQLNGEAIYESRPFVIAGEGPTAVRDDNYDVERIKGQIDTGEAADVSNRNFTLRDFRFTAGGDVIYAIAFDWPANEFHIKSLKKGGALKGNIRRVTMLGVKEQLCFVRNETGLHIKVPGKKPCNYAYVFKVSIVG